MLKKIYEVIPSHDEWTSIYDKDVIRFGDVVQWLDWKGIKALDYEYDMKPSDEFIRLYLAWVAYDKPIDDQCMDCVRTVHDLVCNV